MTTTARTAHAALCNDHAAVAALQLASGELSLIARDAQGDVQHVSVVDAAGNELEPLAAVEALIAARAHAQREVTQVTDHLRLNLQALRAAGVELNVAQLARDTGIPRSTFYVWASQAAA